MTEVDRGDRSPAGAGLTDAERLVLRFLVTMRSGHTAAAYGTDLGVHVPRPRPRDPGDRRSADTPARRTAGPSRAPAWLTYCRAAGLNPLDGIRDYHAALWARGLEAAGLSPATVARKLAAVSSWYAWLAEAGEVPTNPLARLARPYVDPDVSKTPGLTKDQAQAMLGYADRAVTPAARRNAALLYLIALTGARVSEATGADVPHLGIDRGHRVLWVTRKGGQAYPLVVPAPVIIRLEAYFEARRDMDRLPAVPGTAAPPVPLIATMSGKRMRDADVWLIMRQLARGTGLPPELVSHLGPHAVRHTFATLALDAGVPLRDLQDAMGHKDPRTTRRYDRARGRLDRSPGYLLAAYLEDDHAEGT